MSHRGLYPFESHDVLYAAQVPAGRASWVFMEEVPPLRDLYLVQSAYKFHVPDGTAHSFMELSRVHATFVRPH